MENRSLIIAVTVLLLLVTLVPWRAVNAALTGSKRRLAREAVAIQRSRNSHRMYGRQARKGDRKYLGYKLLSLLLTVVAKLVVPVIRDWLLIRVPFFAGIVSAGSLLASLVFPAFFLPLSIVAGGAGFGSFSLARSRLEESAMTRVEADPRQYALWSVWAIPTYHVTGPGLYPKLPFFPFQIDHIILDGKVFARDFTIIGIITEKNRGKRTKGSGEGGIPLSIGMAYSWRVDTKDPHTFLEAGGMQKTVLQIAQQEVMKVSFGEGAEDLRGPDDILTDRIRRILITMGEMYHYDIITQNQPFVAATLIHALTEFPRLEKERIKRNEDPLGMAAYDKHVAYVARAQDEMSRNGLAAVVGVGVLLYTLDVVRFGRPTALDEAIIRREAAHAKADEEIIGTQANVRQAEIVKEALDAGRATVETIEIERAGDGGNMYRHSVNVNGLPPALDALIKWITKGQTPPNGGTNP